MALSPAGACAKPPQLLGRCPDRGLVSRGPGQEALVLVLVPWPFRLRRHVQLRSSFSCVGFLPPCAPWPGRRTAEETLSGSRPCLSPSPRLASFAKTAMTLQVEGQQALAVPKTPTTNPCSFLQVLGGSRGRRGRRREEEWRKGKEKKSGRGDGERKVG